MSYLLLLLLVQSVPSSDYGYYKENEKPKDKMLPKVPQASTLNYNDFL